MIEFIEKSHYEEADELLSYFSYNLNFNSDPFLKCLVLKEDQINAVLVFDEIYDRIEIKYIVVREEYRKQGFGSDLINFLVGYAYGNRCLNITLEVNITNLAAINLYKKHEFKKIGLKEHYYGDNDAIFMIKEFDYDE